MHYEWVRNYLLYLSMDSNHLNPSKSNTITGNFGKEESLSETRGETTVFRTMANLWI